MRVLVTGANGHVGSVLTQRAVESGHEVRAGVRVVDEEHVAPLRSLGVEVVAAELAAPDQLARAVAGVDVVFHAAAVYRIVTARDDRAVRDASLTGTENVLRAAAAAGVPRVVLTSSVAALPRRPAGSPPVTEDDWADEDSAMPYTRAKAGAERAAWRLADELGLELVTVLPAGVLGPGFRRATPTVDLVDAVSRGLVRFGAPRGNFALVDVRDVARAHLLAATGPAGGRFAVVDGAPTFAEIADALHAIDPRIGRPLMTMPAVAAPVLPLYDRVFSALRGTPRTTTPEVAREMLSGRFHDISTERARTVLGWAPQVPWQESLRETLELLRARRSR